MFTGFILLAEIKLSLASLSLFSGGEANPVNTGKIAWMSSIGLAKYANAGTILAKWLNNNEAKPTAV